MMKINTYEDLIAQKRSLQSELALHKSAIQHTVVEIKEKLKPVGKAFAFAEKAVSREPSKNPLFSAGVNVAADFVLKRVILARAGWVSQLVLPYLLKNYSSHLLGDNNNGKSANGSAVKKLSENGNDISRPVKIRSQNFFHRLGDRLKSS